MGYLASQPTSAAYVTDTFSGTGSQTDYLMTVAPASTSSMLVAINGAVQDPSTYAIVGMTLRFSEAPPADTQNISVRYLGLPAAAVANTAYRTVNEFTATAGQTTYSPASYTVGFINVYQNGVRLGAEDYTAADGIHVTLAIGANAGDLITIESFNVSSVLNAMQANAGAVTSALGYTPVNKAGDTITGVVTMESGAGGTALFLKGRPNDNLTQIGALNNNGSWQGLLQFADDSLIWNGGSGLQQRLKVDSGGRVTMPYQPCFHVYASGYGIPGGYWFKLEGFAYTDFNVGGHWSSSAQRFTAPVTGNYVFYIGGWATANASGERYAYSFSVNGSGFAFIGGGNYCITDSPMTGYSRQVRLNAGDYVDAYMFSLVGCNLGGSHMFEFGGYLLG